MKTIACVLAFALLPSCSMSELEVAREYELCERRRGLQTFLERYRCEFIADRKYALDQQAERRARDPRARK